MMKKIIGAVAALVLCSAAFASDLGLYGKINAGWADGNARIEDSGFKHSVGFKGFEITPALGICPTATAFPDKHFDFTFEVALETIFGSGSEYSGVDVKIFNPNVTCFFNWHFDNFDNEFLQHFVPYAGAGIATPIQLVKVEDDDYGWWTDSDGVYRYHSGYSKEFSSTVVNFNMTAILGARYAFTDKFEVNVETGGKMVGTSIWFTRGGVLYRFK